MSSQKTDKKEIETNNLRPIELRDFSDFIEKLENGEFPIKYTPMVHYSPYKCSIVVWNKDNIRVSIASYVPNKGYVSISINPEYIMLLIKDLEAIAKRLARIGIKAVSEEE